MKRNSRHSDAGFRGLQPAADAARPVRAFTLVELMVVIGIIGLLVAITVPALGPMLSANEQAQIINTLNGMCTNGQTIAEANGTPAGIRVERAYTPHSFFYNKQPYIGMRDTLPARLGIDKPSYLNYQQARLVQFTSRPPDTTGVAAVGEPFQPAFEDVPGTRTMSLPKPAWIAPIESIDRDPNDASKGLWALDDSSLAYQPRRVADVQKKLGSPAKNDYAVEFNRLETFFILFDRFGGVRQLSTSPANYQSHYWYRDRTQPYPDPGAADPTEDPPVFPLVDHPDSSARGVLVYNREDFLQLPNLDADRRTFLTRSRPVYVSRSLGELVEGRQ